MPNVLVKLSFNDVLGILNLTVIIASPFQRLFHITVCSHAVLLRIIDKPI